ncbi:MAG: hypothetical protein AAB363_00735, partial [Planctomycetota bacterium]
MRKHARWVGMIGAIVVAIGGLWIGKRQVSVNASESSKPQATPVPAESGTQRSVEVTTPQRQNMSRFL